MLWSLPGPDKELLTLAEVCEWAKHKPRTLKKMIVDGDFPRPRLRAGGKDYWHGADLAAWMQTLACMRPGEMLKEIPDEEEE